MVRPPIATRELALPAHLFNLRSQHPAGRGKIIKRELYWTQDATPTPWSDTYELLLYMDRLFVPRLHVLTPRLYNRLDPKQSLEHVYEHNQLCLYHPGQYDSSMHLADSVMPWAIEWLLHFETWSVTGEWYGGGKHPEPRSSSVGTDEGDDGDGVGTWVPRPRPGESERSCFERAFRTMFPGRPLSAALNWK